MKWCVFGNSAVFTKIWLWRGILTLILTILDILNLGLVYYWMIQKIVETNNKISFKCTFKVRLITFTSPVSVDCKLLDPKKMQVAILWVQYNLNISTCAIIRKINWGLEVLELVVQRTKSLWWIVCKPIDNTLGTNRTATIIHLLPPGLTVSLQSDLTDVNYFTYYI